MSTKVEFKYSELFRQAVIDAFKKLHPRDEIKNLVMFVVWLGSIWTTIIIAFVPHQFNLFNIQICFWLWFTCLFANFAEAMAEGRGKAHADALKKMRTKTMARALKNGKETQVSSSDLKLNDLLQLAPLALHLTNANIRSYYIGRDDVTAWMTPGGASVQLPNGPVIQALLQQALSPSSQAVQDNALTIEVRNGTANPAWDALAAERLNYAGYNTRLAPADRKNYATSLLYDLSPAPDLTRATSLLNMLGLSPSAFVTTPAQANVNYVLLVGEDYKPCFNPNALAP